MQGTSLLLRAAPAAVPDLLPQLLVAGSVALDTRDGPFGRVEETLGGSAVYFALAASLILPVKVVAPVGTDGAKRLAQTFFGHPIDTELLHILNPPPDRRRARPGPGRNHDLATAALIHLTLRPDSKRLAT